MSNYSSIDSSGYRWDGNSFIIGGGSLSSEQFDLLVELSSIHSKKVILAMHDHLVLGDSRKVVCERYGVNAGYLSVCIGRLLRVERNVSKLVRFYC
ncbi:PapB/FocB family fimbrial expression transcriptional regulator [Escherichia albertii]|uniref:PapB/FocB family fimbrial expression transcriptional regulator n=1 Tax=Escherichia albertii TaxID=208962 RepID=UPI000DE3F97A|nr:PapB/FocB family fimbrial expression transcriptional regulator [Escherichia albertii]HAI6885016.1 transcriptional regulator [Escherichia coli]EHK6581758.1 transcriptional regulator [Escherichia albertii]EHW5859179.1 transcriptional regulator [Escherichia albertii]MCU7301632.1 adhesin biosynthesis transcription regulatory family protein [Escherichia albertii]MCZ8930526.1 PapB/FocB family fimbrial expression transcriptional regulator [Escherichia albertii]